MYVWIYKFLWWVRWAFSAQNLAKPTNKQWFGAGQVTVFAGIYFFKSLRNSDPGPWGNIVTWIHTYSLGVLAFIMKICGSSLWAPGFFLEPRPPGWLLEKSGGSWGPWGPNFFHLLIHFNINNIEGFLKSLENQNNVKKRAYAKKSKTKTNRPISTPGLKDPGPWGEEGLFGRCHLGSNGRVSRQIEA